LNRAVWNRWEVVLSTSVVCEQNESRFAIFTIFCIWNINRAVCDVLWQAVQSIITWVISSRTSPADTVVLRHTVRDCDVLGHWQTDTGRRIESLSTVDTVVLILQVRNAICNIVGKAASVEWEEIVGTLETSCLIVNQTVLNSQVAQKASAVGEVIGRVAGDTVVCVVLVPSAVGNVGCNASVVVEVIVVGTGGAFVIQVVIDTVWNVWINDADGSVGL